MLSELDLQEKSSDHSTTLATTSVEVVPANKARTACWFVNNSAVVIHLALGRDASMTTGIRLNAAGGALEINKNNLWRGPICAIAASGTGNGLVITEIETRYD